MSKKKKSESKERRKKEKAKRKAAQRALYESYKAAGQNGKSKRAVKSTRKLVKLFDHPFGPCGNVGCKKCAGVRAA